MFLSAAARIIELNMLCLSFMRHNKFVMRDLVYFFLVYPLVVQH
jgi:hypothetical protein